MNTPYSASSTIPQGERPTLPFSARNDKYRTAIHYHRCNMSNNRTSAEPIKMGYAVKAQVQTHSASSCPFCLFLLATYPTLLKGSEEGQRPLHGAPAEDARVEARDRGVA